MDLTPSSLRQQWSVRDAAHLLRRAQWGASAAEVARAVEDGLDKTLDRLLAPPPPEEPFTGTAALLRQTANDTDDIAQLKTWWLYRMTASPAPLAERMTLFWHNHFATSNVKVRSPKHMAAQNDGLRAHALGDFKELLAFIARDVAMLLWLDGNANRVRSPNENFARELLELFTLGVGHYSERDIKEAARAFTGWHVRRDQFWMNHLQHDTGTKTLFGKSGNFDGGDILQLCLAHDACPRFLARKLLREFVMPAPPEAAVAATAAAIRRHDFHMTPVLRELFTSELFFSSAARHSLIKSPVDFVLGTCRSLEVQPNLKAVAGVIARLGQDLFQPPTVKGWEGGRLWITSATLLQRANFATSLAGSDAFGRMTASPPSLEELAALLISCEADLTPARTLHDRTSGGLEEKLRAALPLVLTLPEYQLA